MHRSQIIILLCVFCMIGLKSLAAQDDPPTEVPATELISIDEKSKVTIAEDPQHKLTVLCFLGTECPLAKLLSLIHI